ncbi:MAG: hypothetical protein OXH83_20345 [Bryobacterales bacterium]|nr:hypothetical protein [Bryobacterales bacterium]
MTTLRVPRRVNEVSLDRGSPTETNAAPSTDSCWLADHRGAQAYVLLGEPGSGKTTAFEMEADADPENSELVSARDFAELSVERHQEWCGKTLFIDGLDEIRTASSNWREPLDSIRRSLEGLGHPRFRLSCRAGEWLGEDDAAALRRLGSYHELVVLRLDPLGEDQVRTVVEERVGQAGAREFMTYAHEHGLHGFLQHPLHIELLLEAGADRGQISGRRGLFDSACRSMTREKNRAHRAAMRGMPRPSESALLDASGYLCASSLLTDSLGWTVDPAEPTPGHPSIREIENADSSVVGAELDRALRTRLFRLISSGRFEPIHRQVAEFLGGQFLGRQVEGRNVSPARLRALMSGDDGAPAPSLRGLAAWIAVHSPAARPSLIRDDPVGVASYGDPSGFSREDQRQLLSNLRVRAREIDIWQWPPAALPSLAAPGALPIVQDMISAPERDNATQSLAYLALRAIAQTDGSSIPGDLRPPLLGVVRDPRWFPGTRAAALKAWIASSSDGGRDIDEALKLLGEIREGRMEDPRRSLTGLLLGVLYPRHVTPDELWDHAAAVAPNPIGSGHLDFWLNELPRRSEDEGCLAEVLDSLCQWLDGNLNGIDDACTHDGIAEVFARALEQHGDDIATERLYAWLAVVLPWMPDKSDLDLSRLIRTHLEVDAPEDDIRSKTNAWLRDRPSTQKALILEIVRRQDDDDIIFPTDPVFSTGSLTLDDVLADAPAADFAFWFLEQAVSLSASRPQLACAMLRRTGVGTRTLAELPDHLRMSWEKRAALPSVSEPPPKANGLTLDEVRARISGHSPLEQCLESLLAPMPQPNPEHPLALKRASKRKEWIDWVLQHADALGRGEGPPSVYHEIARAYLGINRSVPGNTPEARIRSLFLDDDELSRVALDGLRRITRRTDLPTLDELVRLDEDGSISYFVLPLLAALEEEGRTVNQNRARLEGDALQRALGSFFFARGYDGSDPGWYRSALRSEPEDVADAFVKVYRSSIRRSSGVDRHLRALARDESHGNVAPAALPRLLESFPAKAAADQVLYLDYLIPAALEHVERAELASIVHRKLESASLRIGHRIRWLATGMLLGVEPLRQQLDRFLSKGSDARVRELAAFLRVRTVSKRVGSLSAESLAMLVRRLGRYFVPHSEGTPRHMSYAVDEALQTGGLVRTALHALSFHPTAEATKLFRALLDNEDLAAWRESIAEASDAQRVVRLDAEFEPPTVADVASLLKDGQPASAADLAALAVDRIQAFSEQVQNTDADAWRPFWSEGKRGKPKTPKVEPSCQLALLRELRHELPEGVRVEAEARHAGGKRPDLLISFGDFAVPVELKMSSSRDLWTSVTAQLPRYTCDPRSGGYGVYVVFWHGPEHAKSPTPRGKPPRTPDELQGRLTQPLTTEAQRKTSVIVLDVSQP